MSLIVFESTVNMLTVATPSIGGYIIGFDSNTGFLTQKDSNGVVGLVTTSGTLGQVLSNGNSSGTYSLSLGSNTGIKSDVGSSLIKIDNNIVSLSTDNGNFLQSYIYLTQTTAILAATNSKFYIDGTNVLTQYDTNNKQNISLNNYYLRLLNKNVLEFTSGNTQSSGSRLSALISTDNSKINSGVVNSVVLGGQNIIASQSNSAYAPNLYIKNDGFISGILGNGKLSFNTLNEVTLSNSNSLVSILSSSASLPYSNGIFLFDTINSTSTPNVNSGVVYISTKLSSASASVVNSVVIGGQSLNASQSNTVYLGNNVNINNAYTLPSVDGVSGYVLKTDGSGNVSWDVANSTSVVVASQSTFAGYTSYAKNTTYKVTGVDYDLYGGTDIYLTTNSDGILNDFGVGVFYNPRYDQATTGYGIWMRSATYSVNSYVIWGGQVWRNKTGSTGTNLGLFAMDSTNWDLMPFNNTYYNVAYDQIRYDIVNDRITYRNEKNSNIVECTVDTILYFVDYLGYSPIKVFQWGNTYDYNSGYGIGEQIIINSYNENINFQGTYQVNIKMSNNSFQLNINFDVDSYQGNITLDNNSYQNGLYFTASSQDKITLNNNSWNNYINLDNSGQIYFNFNNNSYQENITLSNSSEQSHLIFDDNATQTNFTEITGKRQHSLKLDNFYWDRTGQTMSLPEEDLFLNGNNLSYIMPQSGLDPQEGVKGELVFFGAQSADFSPGYLYSFNGGTWSYADSSATASITKYQLLGIAKGNKVSDGLLVRGYAQFNIRSYTNMTLGHSQYVRSVGNFSDESPGVGNYIRTIGYCVDTSGYGTLYFCPDTYYKII